MTKRLSVNFEHSAAEVEKSINQLCLTRVTHNSLGLTNLWSSGSGSNWNLEMLVFEERGKPEYPEKDPRSKDENQQQTQPTYDTGTGSRTRATLVGGERSHHCAIADHYFWCSGGVSCCFEGVPGYYGMSQRCSGVVPGCSGVFREVFQGCFGVFRGCSGVFQGVPGGSGCSRFYRHPQVRKPTTQTVPVAGFFV